MSMASLRKWYKVPAKRGALVRDRYTHREGQVLSSDGQYLYVRVYRTSVRTYRSAYHPFDLDYLVDGQWLKGGDFKTKHDTRIEATNARWNAIEE